MKMKQPYFYILPVIMLLFFSCGTENKSLEQPNILWIVADDLGTELGCYGDSLVKTPNIDKLANQSTLFTNCFTTAAVCSASRSGMITGMYPVSIGSHQHRTHPDAMKPLPGEVKTITEYFEEAGYFTFNGNVKNPERVGKKDYNFTTEYEIYDGTDWTQRAEGQPFFGQVQIFFPHRPFKHDEENPVDQAKVKLPPYYADHQTLRQDWAFYLESIQEVDKLLGKVIARLEADALLDNTFIFFVGDQGSPMMRHKQFLYDGGTNTPLIVRYPDGKHAGEVSSALISNIDLSAASLSLAGIKIPEHMQGQNFLGKHTPREPQSCIPA
jgi:arylsulfatase A-like enzyme